MPDVCPKCGEAVLFVKSHGATGVLLVHALERYPKVGELVKQACHVPLEVYDGRLTMEEYRNGRR